MLTLKDPQTLTVDVPTEQAADVAKIRSITIRMVPTGVRVDVDWALGWHDKDGNFVIGAQYLDVLQGDAVNAAVSMPADANKSLAFNVECAVWAFLQATGKLSEGTSTDDPG